MIIGSNLIFIEGLPSTNNHAVQLLKSIKPAEGTIIHTDYQSAGKGQPGKIWESEKGKNLLISVILYPSFLEADKQFLISMALSLGICDFMKRYITAYSIKWPNDIYVNNDKIAGILIENSILGANIENTVAGIGININQVTFLSDAPNPVSLSMITGSGYQLTECLKHLATDLDKRYKQLISGDLNSIKQEYTSRLYRLNEWCGYRDKSGSFTGRIISISDSGILLIEKKSGNISEYSFKEIDFIL